jgi:hypothetical protein
MKNIYLIPTDKPSRLIIYSTLLNEFRLLNDPIEDWKHKRHIYITSDEEIKVGDWIYGLFNGGVVIRSEFDVPKNSQYYKEYGLKIILTTDRDLIKDGVQSIDDEFLEWFVKNPSCEFVEVDTYSKKIGVETDANGYREMDVFGKDYKIIIPKEEPKQETLEEAAKRIVTDKTSLGATARNGFVKGANWQAERMYSEEEVEQIFNIGQMVKNYGDYKPYTFKEALKQFKKK